MKRKTEELDVEFDSLIENMQLMNCLDPYEEFKILKESYELKYILGDLHIKEINEIIKKTYLRYKRYITRIDLDGLNDIKNGIKKFIKLYKTETDLSNCFLRYKHLMDIMIHTDGLILDKILVSPSCVKRCRNY